MCKILIMILAVNSLVFSSCRNKDTEQSKNESEVLETQQAVSVNINVTKTQAIDALKEYLSTLCKQCTYSDYQIIWNDDDDFNIKFDHQSKAFAEVKGRNLVQVRFWKDPQGKLSSVVHRFEGNYLLDCMDL